MLYGLMRTVEARGQHWGLWQLEGEPMGRLGFGKRADFPEKWRLYWDLRVDCSGHVGQFPEWWTVSFLPSLTLAVWLNPWAEVICLRHPRSIRLMSPDLQAKVFPWASQGRVKVDGPSSLTSSLGFPGCICEWWLKGTVSKTSSIRIMVPELTTQTMCPSVILRAAILSIMGYCECLHD